MTRISATIRPQELCDKMLLAEQREIVRIPNMIKSGKAKIENIPEEFCLGTGHVKFFYNKLGYLFDRYMELRIECLMRGFNVQNYTTAFYNIPNELTNNWKPDIQKVRPLLVERINGKLSNMKNIKYKGKTVTFEEIKLN